MNKLQRWVAEKVLGVDADQRGLFGVNWGTGGDPAGWPWQQGWVRGKTVGDDFRPYVSVGPYQRCVSVIARDAAAVPWEFFKVDAAGEPSDEPVPNHPVERLWEHPNQFMLGNQFMIGSYISKMVFGEYFWHFPQLTVGGRTTRTDRAIGELQLLHPPSVRRKIDDNGKLRYWLINQRNHTEEELNPAQLVHSMRYNPYDVLHGLPLHVAIMADLIGYHAAAQWNTRFFNEQNGVPTMLLLPQEGMMADAEARERFVRRFNQRHGGNRSVGLLPGGWDVKDLGMSQRDMDFAELRQFDRDEFLAAAGVPPLVAGYLTRPITYNASEQKALYWESTINSFIAEEQAVINSDFLPKIGVTERVYPQWEVVRALLENLDEKAEVAGKLFGMGFTKRQINDRLELGFDMDEVTDADVGYLPFNLMPVEMIGLDRVESEDEDVPEGDGEEPKDGDEEDEAGDKDEDEQRAFKLDGGLRERRRTQIWRNLVVRTRDLETRFNSTIRSHMREILAEVLENLEGTKGWLAGRIKQAEEVPGTVVSLLFDVEAFKRKLQASTRPIHRAAVQRGGESVAFDVASLIEFDISDPRVTAKLAELTGKITRIDDTIERALRDSLVEGVTAGESPQQLAARVRQTMSAELSRSMTIARTETGFAFSTGRNEGMKQAGIEFHEWLSARDAKVRDTHKPAGGVDGEIVRIGELFSNGLQYPNDPNGPPEEIINCRCAAVPVLGEEG